jgi:hypothetical protein
VTGYSHEFLYRSNFAEESYELLFCHVTADTKIR